MNTATTTIRAWSAQHHRYVNVPVPRPTQAETIVRRVLHQDARSHIGRMAAGSR